MELKVQPFFMVSCQNCKALNFTKKTKLWNIWLEYILKENVY